VGFAAESRLPGITTLEKKMDLELEVMRERLNDRINSDFMYTYL
jgi:hypothetical protein